MIPLDSAYGSQSAKYSEASASTSKMPNGLATAVADGRT